MSSLTPRINNLESGNNLIINGAFDIWQRNIVSTSTTAEYLADRWRTTNNLGTSPSKGRSTDVPVNAVGKYSHYWTGTPTGVQGFDLVYRMESSDAASLIDQVVTFKFKYKGTLPNLNLDTASSFFQPYSAGAEDDHIAVGSSFTTDSIADLIFDGTWREGSFTIDLSTFTNVKFGLGFVLRFRASGAAAAWSLNVTDCMLTVGSGQGVFKRAGKTIQEEYALCQRYYWKMGYDSPTFDASTSHLFGYGVVNGSTTGGILVRFPVRMRVEPIIRTLGVGSFTYISNNTTTTITGINASLGVSADHIIIQIITAATQTAGTTARLAKNATTSLLAFESEL